MRDRDRITALERQVRRLSSLVDRNRHQLAYFFLCQNATPQQEEAVGRLYARIGACGMMGKQMPPQEFLRSVADIFGKSVEESTLIAEQLLAAFKSLASDAQKLINGTATST